MSFDILVLLAPGFEEIEALYPVDLWRRAGLSVVTVGVVDQDVTGSHGITVRADLVLSQFLDTNCDPYQAVFLPGGMPGAENLSRSPLVVSLIKKTLDENLWLIAICAAPAVTLGRNGLLRQRQFVGFPDFAEEGKSHGGIWQDHDVVVDGKLITSRAIGTAPLLALEVIRQLKSDEAALQVSRRGLISTR
ncbi:MAG: DJ-1/PfpI family protein [Spirochaetales bacterium]|nr:DJ-1/PfpI family protein [Spirochaetales bacterium]